MTMTLQDALAEVRRLYTGRTDHALLPDRLSFAVIVEAAASGDMIPRTDADLAVALAYQRAADRFPDGKQPWPPHAIRSAVLALAPADALAEVKRMQKTLARAEECAKEMQSDLLGYMAEVKALRMQVEGLSADNARLRGIIARAAITTPEKDATP